MVALAGCRPTLPSLALSPPLCWWAVTTQSAPPLHPNFSHSTIFFVVFPSALFFSSSRQGGYEVWDIACSNVRTHTCTLWGESGAVGLGASERGVSGNPSELVCEGLVNRTGEKKERRKEEWREKNKGGRMSWQGFQTSRSLIAGSVPLLPRTNAKMKGLLMNASHATSWHYCSESPRRKMKRKEEVMIRTETNHPTVCAPACTKKWFQEKMEKSNLWLLPLWTHMLTSPQSPSCGTCTQQPPASNRLKQPEEKGSCGWLVRLSPAWSQDQGGRSSWTGCPFVVTYPNSSL